MARTSQTARKFTAGKAPRKRKEPIQLRIEEILAGAVDEDEDILKVMRFLPTRRLPCITCPDELDPALNPRQCCFDSTSPQVSWTCHSICERCAVLRRLIMEGECVKEAPKSYCLPQPGNFCDNLVGQLLLTTDCEDDDVCGEAASLPQELIDMILKLAVEELRQGDMDYRVLLHVSSMIRLWAMQALEPVEVMNLAEGSGGPGAFQLHHRIPAQVSEVLSYQLLDVTVRRHGPKLAQPKLEGAAFRAAARHPSLAWKVEAMTTPSNPYGDAERHTHTTHSRVVSSPDDPALTVADAYDTLLQAFEGLDAKVWCFASPFLRTYQPKAEREEAISARFTVTLSLPEEGEDASHRFWRFVMY